MREIAGGSRKKETERAREGARECEQERARDNIVCVLGKRRGAGTRGRDFSIGGEGC